ncbi:dirigent protein 1-like [Oryza brachyantha]|uniref:Dirigent protein n=1 Tax=Oryza brachyantha TaxID=4533 RepID=J3MN01_ORYBR|nr:dirigent protein 1-like [Oryza brachyantha]
MAASSTSSLVQLALLVVLVMASASWSSRTVDAAGGGDGGNRRAATHIRLYIHETFSGSNATVAPPVVPSPLGANATFGEVGVLDDALRAGEDPASDLVGRFQGLFVGTDLGSPSYMSAVTLVFTAGEYSGSTITVQGQFSFDAADGSAVERSVVGGTGRFRMARGYSLMEVVSTPTPESVVFRIDVFVLLSRHGQY